ncbi:hypothetical protein [Nocardia sp. NPDC052566]|uniref:hypothetical protein n=1 Tax=Nocardia sp. NPDC052566 TaxID=3364330 RepID=UPI0037C992C9
MNDADVQDRLIDRYAAVACVAIGAISGAGVSMLIRARRSNRSTDENDLSPAQADPSADDLDREQIEQLHRATLSASDSCFELKKLCATVLVPTGTLIVLLNDKKLDASVFVAGLLVIAAFWLADAVGYYYQRKLRVAMNSIWVRRAARCPETYNNIPSVCPVGPLRAAFNSSMLYYLILALLVVLAFSLFEAGLIVSAPGIHT